MKKFRAVIYLVIIITIHAIPYLIGLFIGQIVGAGIYGYNFGRKIIISYTKNAWAVLKERK